MTLFVIKGGVSMPNRLRIKSYISCSLFLSLFLFVACTNNKQIDEQPAISNDPTEPNEHHSLTENDDKSISKDTIPEDHIDNRDQDLKQETNTNNGKAEADQPNP